MPGWYYNKRELKTAFSNNDGIDYEFDNQSRNEGARFIIKVGEKMELSCTTVATGVVYFHRFYMVHSFSSFPKYLTGCTTLFLAGKVEESPKRVNEIIKIAKECLSSAEFAKFGKSPKEELLILERIVLQSIKFDLLVDHPYSFLKQYAKSMRDVTNEREKIEDLLQMAWNFSNDSLCTTLCLQWEPEIIAIAILYLAAKITKYNINNWMKRSEMFVKGVKLSDLEDICHQVLDVYSRK